MSKVHTGQLRGCNAEELPDGDDLDVSVGTTGGDVAGAVGVLFLDNRFPKAGYRLLEWGFGEQSRSNVMYIGDGEQLWTNQEGTNLQIIHSLWQSEHLADM